MKLKNKIKNKWLLPLIFILIIGILLRLFFFTGYIIADPQDEGIYVNHIKSVLKNNFSFSGYRDFNSETANPARTKQFAFFLIFPCAFFAYLFGLNMYSLSLWPLITSLGSIILIFIFGKEIFNWKVGLLAAFLLSIFPMNVFYSTRIQVEGPMLLFSGISVLFFYYGLEKKNKKWLNYLISGIFLSLAFYTKTRVALMGIFFVGFLVWKYLKTKKIEKKFAFFFVGFLIIFSIFSSYFYIQSGNPFLMSHIRIKANEHQFTKAGGLRSFDLVPGVKIYNIMSKPIYYSTLIFGLWHHRGGGVNYFGIFPYLFIFSLIYLGFRFFLKDGIKNIKKLDFFLIWFGFLFLFMEFGFLKIWFAEGIINYGMIIKNPRYLVIVTIPMILTISYAFYSLYKKFGYKILTPLIIISLISSVYFIEINHEYFVEGGVGNLRDSAKFFEKNPDKKVYIDYIGRDHLILLDTKNKERYKTFRSLKNLEEISNSFVVVGGSRSTDLAPSHVYSFEPKFLENSTENWEIVKKYNETRRGVKDMVIYYED